MVVQGPPPGHRHPEHLFRLQQHTQQNRNKIKCWVPLAASRAQAACGYPGPGGLSCLCVVLKSPSPRLSPRICGQAPICAQAPYSHRRPISPGALFALPPCLHRRPICPQGGQAPHSGRRPLQTGALFAQAPYLPRRLNCPGAHMCPAGLGAQAPICALIKVSRIFEQH